MSEVGKVVWEFERKRGFKRGGYREVKDIVVVVFRDVRFRRGVGMYRYGRKIVRVYCGFGRDYGRRFGVSKDAFVF